MLTDKEVKNAQPREKAYKISDSGGLYLYIAPTGLKSWRMKFRLRGKEKLLTFGPYHDLRQVKRRSVQESANPTWLMRSQLRDHSV